MSRFSELFARTHSENRAALVGYLTAGDPGVEESLEIIDAACSAGLDVLELGVPFSDPTADGPVIQRAAGRAVKAGMTLEKGIEMVKKLRAKHSLPLILFTYYNPVLAFGAKRFVDEAVKAGADGVLIVDLPHESSDEIMQYAEGLPFDFIRLISPTTSPQRKKSILAKASGFVYVVSRRGVTGSGTSSGSNIDWTLLQKEICELKQETKVPLCVGFGITSAEDVRNVSKIADGVIIGSAFQKITEEKTNEGKPETAGDSVAAFVMSLMSSLGTG
jgi:tryptophan synthase alpha chain